MSNQRTTFLKRQREQNRKDKARAKQERLAARRAAAREARVSSPTLGLDGQPPPADAAIDTPVSLHNGTAADDDRSD